MRKKFFFILIFFVTLNSTTIYAQCNPNEDPFCEDPDNPIPLDDEVKVLIAASFLFGIWRLKYRNGLIKQI